MDNYLSTRFSYYPANITITEPLGEISLYDYLYAIKNPKPHILEVFREIEKASLEGDKKLKAKLKEKLFYFTPCIKTDGLGRCYENITEWNEILILDFDNLEPEFAVLFKEYLFENYSCIIAVFLSASKCGIKALVRIPKCSSVDEFKSYFYGIASEMQYYRGWDASSKNCSLPNFLTHDPNLLYRIDATVWDKLGIQVDEFKVSEEPLEELTDINPKDVEGIKLMLQRMMAKIDVEQQGHLILRNTSLIAGGLTRYIPMDEMQEYMFELIDNSSYLQKGLHGYRKTCMQMLKLGATNQIEYER